MCLCKVRLESQNGSVDPHKCSIAAVLLTGSLPYAEGMWLFFSFVFAYKLTITRTYMNKLTASTGNR